jgi:hypothetical protein
MCFDKGVVNFGKLIVVWRGKIEMSRESYIVGCNFRKLFNIGDSFHTLYFWYGDFLFFVRRERLGLVSRDDDEGILVIIDLIELFFGADKLEWFGPIVSFAVAHK